jgi:cell division protein FtsI (penicillin-binding protein 3)
MRQALESTYDHLGLPLEGNEGLDQWVSTRSTPEGMELNAREIPEALVPNVMDMGLKDALYLLESRGIQVVADGRGTVRQQSIRAGTRLTKGMEIRLDMSIKAG